MNCDSIVSEIDRNIINLIPESKTYQAMGLVYNYKVDNQIVGVTYTDEQLAEINDAYDLGWMFIARDISYGDSLYSDVVEYVINLYAFAWAKRSISQMLLHNIIAGGISMLDETTLLSTKLDINEAINGINANFNIFNDFTALRISFNITDTQRICSTTNCRTSGCND